MLTDTATMQTIADQLGAAYTNLQATQDTTVSSTAISKIIATRVLIDTQETDTEYPNSNTLGTALHTIVSSMPVTVSSLMLSAPQALDTFFVNQYGSKLRKQFKTGVTWSDSFRALWRSSLSEELIVRLGSVINTSGTWGGFVGDKTIGSDATLTVVVPNTNSSTISLVLTLSHTNPNVANEIVNITVPGSTAATTIFPIGTTGKSYSGVVSLVATGGESGDHIEVWVA